MSPKQLPKNYKQLEILAKKAGFVFSRQKGSHVIFYHQKGVRVTIPNHGQKALHPKIIKMILRDIESVK